MSGSTTFVLLTAVALTAGGIYIYKSRQSNNENQSAAGTSEQDSDEPEHFYNSPSEMWNAYNMFKMKSELDSKRR